MAAIEMAQTETSVASRNVRRMFGLDLDAWNVVMVSSLGMAAVAAVVVVLSTAIVIRLQKQAELESAERIAQLTTQGDIARRETADAKLQLEQLKTLAGPRELDHETFVKEISGKPKAPVAIWYLPDASDSWLFALRLQVALNTAGWQVDQAIPIPEPPKGLIGNPPERWPLAGNHPGSALSALAYSGQIMKWIIPHIRLYLERC